MIKKLNVKVGQKIKIINGYEEKAKKGAIMTVSHIELEDDDDNEKWHAWGLRFEEWAEMKEAYEKKESNPRFPFDINNSLWLCTNDDFEVIS